MKILYSIVDVLILLLILGFPIVLFIWLSKKYPKPLFRYFVISVVGLTFLIFSFAWWTDLSNSMLLAELGYNDDALTTVERYQDVPSNDLEKVKALETSVQGIGWPAKAIFGLPIIIPYILIIYFVGYAIRKVKTRPNTR